MPPWTKRQPLGLKLLFTENSAGPNADVVSEYQAGLPLCRDPPRLWPNIPIPQSTEGIESEYVVALRATQSAGTT